MAKSPLKDKDFIADDNSLSQILGNRWNRYQETLQELGKRKLYAEMYWYGPSSGWGPRFLLPRGYCFGLFFASKPPIGFGGVFP